MRKIILGSLLIAGCSVQVDDEIAQTSQRLTGNISPKAIQIDTSADLYSSTGVPLNTGATTDWVLDATDNSGTGCLTTEGTAICNESGVTSASGGVGHWNGLRLVDGTGSGDQNIFLNGGKENDTTTWNIGAGSVGSSKYDISQAYLANNQTTLYFGMERSGNNGTTAFDFEFNQLAPQSLSTCPNNPDVPCRSVGDVLFTFEMQGSGSSGSAVPHKYTWNGSTYVEGTASGIVSSINSAITTGAPWGHVDSHGNWVLGNLDRFTFAEAMAPISLLPGVNGCGGKAFVQVRTRSSATANSDLKDTTKVFEFLFNNISSSATLTPSCDKTLGYSADATDTEGNPVVSPSCHWTFSNGMTSDVCSGTLSVEPGIYTATVVVADPNSPACTSTTQTAEVEVLEGLSVHLTPQKAAPVCPMVEDAVSYDAVVSGGNGNYNYSWNGISCSGSSCTIDPGANYCYTQSVSVTVSDDSGMCSSATSETETYNKVTVITTTDN